ncbi:PREDICTED: uncharacterized protein LOC109230103 [Nicotiana attenuata]|uniref:uncharacterized protein LOC109230103 n=1 Tax=Nicotiana attenuata TaxID=49451 RepID=UPI0009058CDD|nr:PREDICTED: uncharacterized protein LOC109230103 [Nicotiana attenuata]
MEWMDLPPVADDWVVQAFTQGLNVRSSVASQQLKQNLIKYPAATWADAHNRYQSKIRVEDDQLGAPSGSIGPKEAPRLSEYNFNMDAVAIVLVIGCIKDTKWPRPLQIDPTQRDPNQICKYHGTHGHRTEDCQQLKEFLSDRAKNHFKYRDSNKQNEQDEPQHVIHMIIGGVDIPQVSMIKRTKVSITREKRTRYYIPEGTLSFNDEDAERIMQPHNDALVISVLMNKTRVKGVLIDPCSSANII